MVEGARLESACRGNPSTVGSNPTLSATLLTRVGPHTKKPSNSEALHVHGIHWLYF